MTFLTRAARIRNDRLRAGLLAALFLPQMAHFAVGLAWNAPRRFFMAEPWRISWMFWRMAAAGEFIGPRVNP